MTRRLILLATRVRLKHDRLPWCAAVGVALMATAIGSAAASPRAIPICLTSGERAHTVRYASRSGATITGVLLGRGRAGIVFANESPGDLCDWMPTARILAAEGYAVLPIDLNGFGVSTIAPTSPGLAYWDRDVAGAARVLRSHGVRRVALVGAGDGGTAVVAAATKITPPVSAVVDISGPVNVSGVDALAAAAHLHSPVLYVAARRDAYAADVRATFRATPARLRRLALLAGGLNGMGLLNPDLDPHAAELSATIASFLRRHTTPPRSPHRT